MVQCPNCQHRNRDGARFCALCRTELFPAVIGGDYHILSVIDSGGMGRVYKAERQGQIVAVKEIKDNFRDARDRQDAINRFMAEALTLARLRHPNIPVIHRNFVENGRYYLVIDWIEGQDLSVLMKQRLNMPLPEEQVLDWALQLCDVLEYLHGQNPPIIFRDLKPANIILRPDGRLVLVDFGIAKLFAPGQQGTLIGTPGYAAMEQYQGLADPRSDIYGLGVTLYFLTTGRDPQQNPPFIFPPARSINPAVSPAMESVLQKAMEYRLDDRWASVGDMRTSLVKIAEFRADTILAGRYEVTGDRFIAAGLYGRKPMQYGFAARDLSSGIKCGLFSMRDPHVQPFSGLTHRCLPRMEIITIGDQSYLVCEEVTGVRLANVVLHNDSSLTSIGLQLCSLFEETGSRVGKYPWGNLRAQDILVDQNHRVWIDVNRHLRDQIQDDYIALDDTIKIEPLSVPLLIAGKSRNFDALAVEEVRAVALAMAIAATGKPRGYELYDDSFPSMELFGQVPRISPSQASILSAAANRLAISTMTDLKECLRNPPPMARAQTSPSHIDFGVVKRGENRARSIRVSTNSQGLFYGEIIHISEWLRVRKTRFGGFHPCRWDIRIELDTRALPRHGQNSGQIVIFTPMGTLQIATQVDVRPAKK
jgi:serine/threonine protein kinase